MDELTGDGYEGLGVALAHEFVPLGVVRLRRHLPQARGDAAAASQRYHLCLAPQQADITTTDATMAGTKAGSGIDQGGLILIVAFEVSTVAIFHVAFHHNLVTLQAMFPLLVHG